MLDPSRQNRVVGHLKRFVRHYDKISSRFGYKRSDNRYTQRTDEDKEGKKEEATPQEDKCLDEKPLLIGTINTISRGLTG